MHSTVERFVTPDGLTLVADVMGDPSAPPVLFMHGGGQTRGSWKGSLAVVAARGYRAYAVDARGHGESDWSPAGDYSMDAYANDLGFLLARIGGRPVVVGASMGGLASLLHLGENRRSNARALILVDVAARVNREGVQRILDFMSANPEGFASIDEAADAVSRYNPDRPRPSSNAGLARNLRERNGRLHWHWDPAFLTSRDEEGVRLRLETAAEHMRIPCLLVHAGKSDVVREEELKHLQAAMPDCRYVKVGEAGHMIAGDDNDAFNSAIIDYLDWTRDAVPPEA